MVAAAQFLGDFLELRRRVKSPQSRGIGAHMAPEWDLQNLASSGTIRGIFHCPAVRHRAIDQCSIEAKRY
jgi:hypothetical protein